MAQETKAIKPGDPYPEGDNLRIVLRAGTKGHRPFAGRRSGVTLEGEDPEKSWIDGARQEFGVRFHDQSKDIQILGLGITNAVHCIKASLTENLLIERVRTWGAAAEGITIGGGRHIRIRHCRGWQTGEGWAPEYAWGRGHFVYFNWGIEDAWLEDSEALNVGGCGVQVNGTPSKGMRATNIRVRRCKFINTGIGGGAGTNIMAVTDAEFEDVLWAWNDACPETEHLSRENAGGFAAFDDGAGTAKGKNERISLRRCTIFEPHRYGVQSKAGSVVAINSCIVVGGEGPEVQEVGGQVRVADSRLGTSGRAALNPDLSSKIAGIGWSPIDAPTPPPPPPDDLGARIRELEAALAASEAARQRAEAKIAAARAALG